MFCLQSQVDASRIFCSIKMAVKLGFNAFLERTRTRVAGLVFETAVTFKSSTISHL